MLAATVSLLLAGSTLAEDVHPVLLGYDVVEYFSLNSTDEGVMGSAEFQANLTSTDDAAKTSAKQMEVK